MIVGANGPAWTSWHPFSVKFGYLNDEFPAAPTSSSIPYPLSCSIRSTIRWRSESYALILTTARLVPAIADFSQGCFVTKRVSGQASLGIVKLGTKTTRASSKCGRKQDIQRSTDSRRYKTDHRTTICLFVSARAENQMIAPDNILSTRYPTPLQSTQEIFRIIEHARGNKD